jgi:pimeloyl-ACP methyl ester carboxylesterase
LAVHGLSSNRRLWNWLRAEAPAIALVAPNLRGRGGSVRAGGPSSLARHAEDLVAVLDALGLERVRVCGMSMGAFVAVVLAVAHPDRVRDLVLLDGGFPMAGTEALTADQVRETFAAQVGRADRTFADVPDYAAYFLQGAPLLDPTDLLLRDYLAHDLREGRVRLDPEVRVADAVDTARNFGPTMAAAADLTVVQGSPDRGAGRARPGGDGDRRCVRRPGRARGSRRRR